MHGRANTSPWTVTHHHFYMASDSTAAAKQEEEEEKRLAARVAATAERIVNFSDFNRNPDGQAGTRFSQLS